jgi:predicted  nucleic acid-binding Zn-ribbon protein
MSKAITLSLWMTNSKLKIEQHEREISQDYQRLKELNKEMANLFVSIDNHTKEIEFLEFEIAETRKQKEALKNE